MSRRPGQFGPSYWAEVDRAAAADRQPRGWVALLITAVCLAGLGFACWSLAAGYNPLWWRVTGLALGGTALISGLRARRHARRRS